MKRDYGKYLFSAGLLLLVIQFLILLFDVVSGNSYADVQFAVVEKLTFMSFIETTWASILGVVLLIVVYIRRFAKGPDPMMELVGALLWIIQILGLYIDGTPLMDFIFVYIVGILGTALVLLTGVFDSKHLKKS